MTLDEFVECRGSFIKDVLDSFRIFSEKYPFLEGSERNAYFDLMLKNKYILWGYIRAAFDYGCISYEEKVQLEKEMRDIIGL